MSHELQQTDERRAAVAEFLMRAELRLARKRAKIIAFKSKPIQRTIPKLFERAA